MPASNTPNLDQLEEAVAAGEIERARALLPSLTESEREVLRIELGEEGLERLYEVARRPRGPKLGRVVVLNGIMGATLRAVEPGGDSDRIWFHILRIMNGRFTDLETTLSGAPLPGRPVIVSRRLMKRYYIPLVLEIGRRWHVKPFPFDWRLDIDDSVSKLAAEIRTWAGSEPVHLVAHSMGGLVCRRLVSRFPDLWKSMDDPEGHRRGGRMIMLGTPNRGSFAVPLILTGEEKMARTLAKLDLRHGINTIRRITNKFPGAYQMLPSPLVDLGDDHRLLFSKAAWGDLPVHQVLLDQGKGFQEDLDRVVDTERMIYVAGYDQRTPHRIRKVSPGSFEYQETLDGDGRVPHQLGLLEGVRTFWVLEKHGRLPKNGSVLDGMHDLLRTGDTKELEPARPVRRAAPISAEWKRPAEIEPLDEEVEALVEQAKKRRRSRKPLTSEEEARLETLLLGDYLGEPMTLETAPAEMDGRGGGDGRPKAESTPLRVEVVWDDITKARGNVYCVGHYEGVVPQAAELALDRVISGVLPEDKVPLEEMVLNKLTRRGVLGEKLGDVQFFPWAQSRGPRGKLVAVAGMGYPGTFTRTRLRQLSSDLTWAIGSLPDRRVVCTVLIGSGNGGLPIDDCVEGLMMGLSDALAGGLSSPIRTVRIVEWDLIRALRIHEAVSRLRDRGQLRFGLGSEVIEGSHGGVGRQGAYALALSALAQAGKPRSRRHDAVLTVARGIPTRGGVKQNVLGELGGLPELVGETDVTCLASKLRVDLLDQREISSEIPARMSFIKREDSVRVAAITSTAVVPERNLQVDFSLVKDLIQQANDPAVNELSELARDTNNLLIPEDFTEYLEFGDSVIFEVDRAMAQVSWELMATDLKGEDAKPIATGGVVARQLRTTYSPPPQPLGTRVDRFKALVVGDPGDPNEAADLPGARFEAERVFELLRARHDCEVEALIGAPDRRGQGPIRGIPPASLRNVLRRLWRGDIDLLHYAGHGDFDPSDPRRVGWLFKGASLTATELERVDRPPRLIVANACLSARTSERTRGGQQFDDILDVGLLPSLADEFFRRGVRNYIGTAWEVNDQGAVLFAETLYESFLPGKQNGGITLGEALLKARQKLHAERAFYGALWAAYQHYGDPRLRW